MTFTEALGHISQGFEVAAALILALGLVWAMVLSARVWRRTGEGRKGYAVLRESFGGVLLLALEVLVAADLIRTVAVAPTLRNVAGLGLIVLIRTFLSFSLQIEIEGMPPWRRAAVSGAVIAARAAGKASASDAAPPAGDQVSSEPDGKAEPAV